MDTPVLTSVRVRVLGGFELRGEGGGDLTPTNKKLRALVAVLALARGAGWPRERLTSLLWGDRDEEQARGSLRQALAELRRLLGDGAVRADRATVALDPAALCVDAVEFTELVAAGAWERAAVLYRGDLLDGVVLPDDGFADWLLIERTRLHDLAVGALARLLETQSGAAAVATAERLLRLDCACETAHRALMRIEAARGNRARALRQYQLCRDLLWRELSVKPEPETDQLFNEIRSTSTFARAATLRRAPETAPEPAAQPSGPAIDRPRLRRVLWRHRTAAFGLLIAFAGAGLLASWQPWDRPSEVRRADALPDKPSIAVLPFENMSDDPLQAYFADGIAQDLMTDLSRISGLFVIARNSTFAYRGKAVDIRDVARDLAVRYVIEGSVRRAGDLIRINVELIDAESGRQTWAERYDGNASEIFALQDRVTAAVASALALQLTAPERRELLQHDTAELAAYDAFLRGWDLYQRATPDSFALAIPYFEQAVAADPAYGRAYAALAMIYFQSYDQRWAGILHMSANDAYRQARDYLKIAQRYPTSTSHQVAGNVSRDHGWYDDALQEFDAAIALEPSDSRSYAYAAYSLIWADRPLEAQARIETAMRLDPHYPPLFIFYQGLAQFGQGRLQEAAATLERAARLTPDDVQPALFLAAVYGKSGRRPDAQRAIGIVNAIRIRQGGIPLTLDELCYGYKSTPSANADRLIEGLRLAGLPKWFESGPFDAQQLDAHEVDGLIFGHRVHGRSLGSGEEHALSVSADGTAIMSGGWGAGSGTARLDGNRLCFDWTTGDANCAVIYRNIDGGKARENEYIWFSHRSGAFPFSPAD
jgi:TolB-like protein/DNA-binding SARP family transcriptional activator/Tfp pilus assembly protein PilF